MEVEKLKHDDPASRRSPAKAIADSVVDIYIARLVVKGNWWKNLMELNTTYYQSTVHHRTWLTKTAIQDSPLGRAILKSGDSRTHSRAEQLR